MGVLSTFSPVQVSLHYACLKQWDEGQEMHTPSSSNDQIVLQWRKAMVVITGHVRCGIADVV